MSMPSLDPEESPARLFGADDADRICAESRTRTDADVPTADESVRRRADGWTLVALIPYDGQRAAEPMFATSWHGRSGVPSRRSGIRRCWPARGAAPDRDRSSPRRRPARRGPGRRRGPGDRLPSGYQTQAEDAGAVLLESGTDRAD